MSFQFKENNGLSAFMLFYAIKLHFTSNSYDYFKYHGKTSMTENHFMKRKDKYSFYKMSRKYNLEEMKNYYVANFLDGDINWIGAITSSEGEEVYRKWQTRVQRLTYQFEQDIIHLLEESDGDPNNMLKVVDGQYPMLFKSMMQNEVTIETVVILNDMMNFFPMWEKKITDDIIWPNWKLRLQKYSPFLIYDKPKFKAILKEKINEN